MRQYRRVLYFSGGWSRSHVWRGMVWGLWSSTRCACGQFVWSDAKLGDVPGSVPPRPPRGWPVSVKCRRAAKPAPALTRGAKTMRGMC